MSSSLNRFMWSKSCKRWNCIPMAWMAKITIRSTFPINVCNANNFSIMSRWKEDVKDKQKIIWRVFYLKGSKKGTWFHCFRTKVSGGQMVIFINYFRGFFPTFLLCLLRRFLQIVSIELFFYDKLFWSVIKCIIWLVNNKRKN